MAGTCLKGIENHAYASDGTTEQDIQNNKLVKPEQNLLEVFAVLTTSCISLTSSVMSFRLL